MKFKKGDLVRHTKFFKREGAGEIVEILDSRYTVLFHGNAHPKLCKCEYLELVTPCSEVKKKKQDNVRSWSFDTVHEKDIDWDELARDLSKKNPIALVTIEGPTKIVPIMIPDKELVGKKIRKVCSETGQAEMGVVSNPSYYVLIHESVITKAQCLAAEDVDPRINPVVKLANHSEFSLWIDLIKQVKYKPWPQNGRCKGKVSVVLPTI